MPRKRNKSKQQQAKAKGGVARSMKSKEGNPQGPLSHLVDLGANTIKGIGRGLLPGLFKTTMADAPNNVGIVAPRALYRVGTGAQRIAEFDPDRSVRITGCGLFADGLSRNAAYSIYPFTPSAINPFPAWRGVSPMSVDPRMMQLADTYQFYAFRALRFSYIPETGTSGAVTQVNLALGISQDSQEFVDIPTPSLTQMLEQNNSILTPVWCATTLSYTHDGTRVWRTDPSGEGTIDAVVQCLLGGVLSNGTTTGVNDGKLGEIYVEYVCDLYEPQPVTDSGEYTVALPYTFDGTTGIYTPQGYQIYIDNGLGYPTDYNSFVRPPATYLPPVPLLLEEKKESSLVVPAVASNTSSARARRDRRLGSHILPSPLGLPQLATAADRLSPLELSRLRELLRSPTQSPQDLRTSTLALDLGREGNVSSPTSGEQSPDLA